MQDVITLGKASVLECLLSGEGERPQQATKALSAFDLSVQEFKPWFAPVVISRTEWEKHYKK